MLVLVLVCFYAFFFRFVERRVSGAWGKWGGGWVRGGATAPLACVPVSGPGSSEWCFFVSIHFASFHFFLSAIFIFLTLYSLFFYSVRASAAPGCSVLPSFVSFYSFPVLCNFSLLCNCLCSVLRATCLLPAVPVPSYFYLFLRALRWPSLACPYPCPCYPSIRPRTPRSRSGAIFHRGIRSKPIHQEWEREGEDCLPARTIRGATYGTPSGSSAQADSA